MVPLRMVDSLLFLSLLGKEFEILSFLNLWQYGEFKANLSKDLEILSILPVEATSSLSLRWQDHFVA